MRQTRFAEISWRYTDGQGNTVDPPSDLAGFHVEIAGSGYGPWRRVTQRPVAWWERRFQIQNLGVRKFPTQSAPFHLHSSYSGHMECLHYRVIAIDEYGHESSPQEVTIGADAEYPMPGCPQTPEAPTNLVASTHGDPASGSCRVKLEWDPVDGAAEYQVYRYVFPGGLFFYNTQTQAAMPGVPQTYIEFGDGNDGNVDPNLDCPTSPGWHNGSGLSSLDSCDEYPFSAFYVTARGAEGGESPRSNIVFWDCAEDPGYVLNDHSDVDEVLFAGNGESTVEQPGNLEVCAVVDTEPADWESRDEASWPLKSMLTFGAGGGGGPEIPFQILDVHVDHLGSTRLVTDDSGTVVSEHKLFPFGEEVMPLAAYSKRMYTGHERDLETGLDYMLARYYGSTTSRFLSVDPALYVGRNMLIPQRWNRYGYVLNNPLKYYDPDGEELRLGTGADKSLAAIRLSVPKADRGAISMGQNKAGQTIVKVDNSHKSSDLNFKNIQKASNSPGIVEINQTPANQPMPFKIADGSVKSKSLAATGDPGRTLPSEGTKGAANAPTSTQPGVTEVHIASELSPFDQAPVVAAELAGHAVPGLEGEGAVPEDEEEHEKREMPAIEQAKKNRKEK